MCSIITKDETEDARNATAEEAQAQVDLLMEYDRKLKNVADNQERLKIEPPRFGMRYSRSYGLFVWFDTMNFCSSRHKGFYYVRYQNSMLADNGMSTAYEHPAVVIEKSKLPPQQVEFMEMKCTETRNAPDTCGIFL